MRGSRPGGSRDFSELHRSGEVRRGAQAGLRGDAKTITHAKVGSKALGDVSASGEDGGWRVLRGDTDQPFGGVMVSADGCIGELTAPEAIMLKEPADQ